MEFVTVQLVVMKLSSLNRTKLDDGNFTLPIIVTPFPS